MARQISFHFVWFVGFSVVALGSPARGGDDAEQAEKAKALVEKGRELRQQEKLEEAIAAYTEAIKLDPKSDGAFGGRAHVYFDQKAYDLAIADFSSVVRLRPDPDSDANPLLFRGLCYYFKQEYDKANKDYDKVLDEWTDKSLYAQRALVGKAMVSDKKEEYGDAIRYSTKAIKAMEAGGASESELIKPYELRARAYGAEGDSKRAKMDRAKADELREKAGQSGKP